MKLTSKQVKALKAKAHKLSPMVQIGKNGISESAVEETLRALNDHELIKVKIIADDKHVFAELANEIASQTKASMVGTIGRIAIIFKRSNRPERQRIDLKIDS